MSEKISEVLIIVFVGTSLMLLLVIFIISFFLIHQRRQQANKLENAKLKAQFEQEILNAENEIKENTIHHISQELHDNVGQMLTLVKIHLNNLAEESPLNKKVIDSKEIVNRIIADIRALSKSLNSDNLLNEGLEKAICFELDRIRKLGNFEVEFLSKYTSNKLDQNREVLVFRIFQELLQNCLKHAKAKKIHVSLEEEGLNFKLQMTDDGRGFDFEEKLSQNGFESGSGLKNLNHRVNLMQGKIVIERGSQNGVKALLTIPL